MQRNRSGAAGEGSTRPPAYRNLRVWIESFELAMDSFQLARSLEGPEARAVGRRLIDSSSRMPVAIARGQSSGSATQFIRSLHEGLSDLSEMETHLLMLEQLGFLPLERARGYEHRLAGIRRMASALICRLRVACEEDGAPLAGASRDRRRVAAGPPPPSDHDDGVEAVTTLIRPDGSIRIPRSREKGSALLMALLVSAALAIVGFTLLQISSAESLISARARDRDQVLQVAEAGVRAVKSWFDAPTWGDPAPLSVRRPFLGRFDLRDPTALELGRRLLDHDGDPATPLVLADGSTGRERYRQGREVAAGMPHLDLFHKPYRADLSTSLRGVEGGPDLILEDQPGRVDLLDELNAVLFPRQDRTGRLERIELYGPQTSSGARLGMATIEVMAAKYARLDRDGSIPVVPPGARPLARAVVRAGLAEIPVALPRGPLEACGSLASRGRLRAAWGRVIASGDVELPAIIERLDAGVASTVPYASFDRRIGGLSPGDALADWLDDPDTSIEDPWLKVVAGGELTSWADRPDQPFPYDPSLPVDTDHSNLFQRVPGILCAAPRYHLWKRIAQGGMPGDRDTHYFSFDQASGLFRENGGGAARSVRDWTHGRSGLFFFDTADGTPPHDGNLTPAVVIAGGSWSTAGVILLHAESFFASDVVGTPRVLYPPGEPFDDADHDLAHGAGEMYVNLRYATAADSGTAADEMLKEATASQSVSVPGPDGEPYVGVTTMGRDRRGVPISKPVNLYGWLFNSGDIVAEGEATHFGSLMAGRDVVQPTLGADTPSIYFDARLNTGEWPPPDLAMPRTYVTFWQTSRP